MNNENKNGRVPDYSNDGIAVWVNQTKDGKPYLSVKLVGHNVVNAFKQEPKVEKSIPVVTSVPSGISSFNESVSKQNGG